MLPHHICPHVPGGIPTDLTCKFYEHVRRFTKMTHSIEFVCETHYILRLVVDAIAAYPPNVAFSEWCILAIGWWVIWIVGIEWVRFYSIRICYISNLYWNIYNNLWTASVASLMKSMLQGHQSLVLPRYLADDVFSDPIVCYMDDGDDPVFCVLALPHWRKEIPGVVEMRVLIDC